MGTTISDFDLDLVCFSRRSICWSSLLLLLLELVDNG
jgi:hypothetical protein